MRMRKVRSLIRKQGRKSPWDGWTLSALKDLDLKLVQAEQLRSLDPGLLSFFNINTEKDLARASQIWLCSEVVLENSVDDVDYDGKQGDLKNQASKRQEEYGD